MDYPALRAKKWVKLSRFSAGRKFIQLVWSPNRVDAMKCDLWNKTRLVASFKFPNEPHSGLRAACDRYTGSECPIDSIILNKVGIRGIAWSSVASIQSHQYLVNKIIERSGATNLAEWELITFGEESVTKSRGQRPQTAPNTNRRACFRPPLPHPQQTGQRSESLL
jgi:hypothetical protein